MQLHIKVKQIHWSKELPGRCTANDEHNCNNTEYYNEESIFKTDFIFGNEFSKHRKIKVGFRCWLKVAVVGRLKWTTLALKSG